MLPVPPSRHKAVTDTGVQLILAGPGSGKTRVITEKILHLIQKGVKPENILALTFSDKAAHGMPDRLREADNHERSHHQHLPCIRPPGAAGQRARPTTLVFGRDHQPGLDFFELSDRRMVISPLTTSPLTKIQPQFSPRFPETTPGNARKTPRFPHFKEMLKGGPDCQNTTEMHLNKSLPIVFASNVFTQNHYVRPAQFSFRNIR